jgi:hypothetical protein
MAKQDMCPICTDAFKEKELVIKYRLWGIRRANGPICLVPYPCREATTASGGPKRIMTRTAALSVRTRWRPGSNQ